jgi:hypothetical protein
VRQRPDRNTWTIALPSTFLGALEVHGMRSPAQGALHTITVDGSASGTWDTRGAVQSVFGPTLVQITGLAAGAHTIVGTVGAISSGGTFDQLHYYQLPRTDPPPIAYADINQCPIYLSNQTDATIAAENPTLRAIASEFSADARVQCVLVDSLVAYNVNNFAGADIHTNERGVAVIVPGFLSAMKPMVNRQALATGWISQTLSQDTRKRVVIPDSGLDLTTDTVALVAGRRRSPAGRLRPTARPFLQPTAPGPTVVETARTPMVGNFTTGVLTISSVDTQSPKADRTAGIVAPIDPRFHQSQHGARWREHHLGAWVVAPYDGTLHDFSFYFGAPSDNCHVGIYGSGPGNRTLLWDSGSLAITGTTAWQVVADRALAGKAGQHLEFVVHTDNATVKLGRFAALSNLSDTLPAHFFAAAGGASPKLMWEYSIGFYGALPATITEGLCASWNQVVAAICRIVPSNGVRADTRTVNWRLVQPA